MTVPYLVAALILLVANGFFVGAEFALVAARRSRLERLEPGSDRASMALRSIRELPLMLAGAQLGITMCSVGLGFVAEPAVAGVISSGLGGIGALPPALAHTISFLIALAIVTFLHMVLGEIAPKNIAIARPEQTALWLAVPFRAFVNLFRPLVHLLNVLANGGARMLGVQTRGERSTAHTAEEIGAMIEQSAREGLVGDFQLRLLSGAIGFKDTDAGAAMVPRVEMTAAPVSCTAARLEGVVAETGHSRIPVFVGDLDHIIGFWHAKDLLGVPAEAMDRAMSRRLIRPMLVVPESRKVQPLLLDMQRERKHFALVVDEHGGTSGIVTIEDLVEELVGEIRDEHDVGELGVERLAENRYLVPGTLRIDEASDRLGIDLPEGEYETVAGFLMDRLGRVPKRGDLVEQGDWRLSVRSMHRRRVVEVLAERGPTSALAG